MDINLYNELMNNLVDENEILDIMNIVRTDFVFNIASYEQTISSSINKVEQSIIPYDLENHKFKKEFISTLKLLINLDYDDIKRYLKLTTASDNSRVKEGIGFSFLHDILNVNFNNQNSRTLDTDNEKRKIKSFLQSKFNLHSWYLGGFPSDKLRNFIKLIEHILGGKVNEKNKWTPKSNLINVSNLFEIFKYQVVEQPIIQNDKKSEKEVNKVSKNDFDLNIIFYGPPGTGKTYNTIKYAVAICDEKSIEEVESMNPNDLKKRFDELRNTSRIEFTTFHQSYGYEEFIEGIKPDMDDNNECDNKLKYKIESGIFKKFCHKARLGKVSKSSYYIRENPAVWVVLLDGTGNSALKEYCFDKGEIRIGFINDNRDNYKISSVNHLYNDMKKGDIVFVQKNNSTIDAIGVITGDAEDDFKGYDLYPRVRKVEWLAKNIYENIIEINGGLQLGRNTVYELQSSRINYEKLYDLIKKYDKEFEIRNANELKFVFIIDEINRGNISKIFGELITLIEKSKRDGMNDATSAELPYSKLSFSVPKNVYILGTMNTADRSIALLDTALRRRFKFIEMMPNISLLKNVVVKQNELSVDIGDILKIINERIEFLFDREHTIGHAYFWELKDNPNLNTLSDIFRHSILPLLQEYFYEDYEKIQLVLGDNEKTDEYKFVKKILVKPSDIFKRNAELDIQPKFLINDGAFKHLQSYVQILMPNINIINETAE